MPGFDPRSHLLAASIAVLLAVVGGGLSPNGQALGQSPSTLVRAYETTANLSDHLTALPSEALVARPTRGALVLAVNDAVRYQTITGFGAAMTDSSAWLLDEKLSPALRARTMARLFTRAGIDLGFVRIPMGASDFSATGVPYSYDDLSRGHTDPALTHFSIGHDERYILPALREMLALNPRVFTLANPWSPPPWMKRNDRFDNLHATGVIEPRFYRALANYFVKFLEAYQQHGVRVDAVTPQNEPRAQVPWPGAEFIPSDAGPWVARNLVPALAQAGLRTQVYGLDDAALEDARRLLRGPARSDLTGLAFHCYNGGMPDLGTIHAAYPREPLILSECSPGIIPYSTSEVAIDATRQGASSVELWNLALDPRGGPVEPPDLGCPGCTGIVTVAERTHSVSYGANYYGLGQVSKFVAPGAVRIASPRFVRDYATTRSYGITRGLDDVAFRNPDGTDVLVAYNHAVHPISFALASRGRYASYVIPAGATLTLTWR